MADHRGRTAGGLPQAVSSSVGGSSRAKAMLAMATGGGGKGKLRTPPGRPAPPPVTFERRNKRPQGEPGDGEGCAAAGLGGETTPKRQRTPAGAECPSVPVAAPRPSSLLAARPGSTAGSTGAAPRLTCYSNTQRLRELAAEGGDALARRRAALPGSSFIHRRPSSGGGLGRLGGHQGLSRLPAGMLNLGNTCYLNAVLQVLLSLPSFVADLRSGRAALEAAGQPLPPTGVYSALLDCAAARDRGFERYLTPASLKRALDAASSAFHGTLQQDAHELLCSLLDAVQGEVLAREVARLGRTRVAASETADPGARNFGFAVQHELVCSACGHASQLVEQYTHLSLELPPAQPGSIAACSVTSLLRDYFKEEQVDKACEACGAASAAHALRHAIKRLPRVLVLHLKRFKISWSVEQQRVVCQKVHTGVEMPEAVQLGGLLAAGAAPPLPGGQQQEAGKENEQLEANAGGAGGSAQQQQQHGDDSAAKGPRMGKRAGVSFYGGGGAATPVAASALLSPGALHSPAMRRRLGTPAAPKLGGSLADDEDAVLQRVLAESLLDQQGGGQLPGAAAQQQQQQQQDGPELSFGVGGFLRRHSAEEGECPLIRAGSPAPRQAVVASLLPAEVEAAAASAGAAGAAPAGGCHKLEDQWFMGFKRGSPPAAPTAAEREAAELQRVLEMSRQEHEAAAAAAATAAARASSAAGGAAEQEEADLLRAIELSMLEQQQRPGDALQQHGGSQAAAGGDSCSSGGGEGGVAVAAAEVPGASAAAAAVTEELHAGEATGEEAASAAAPARPDGDDGVQLVLAAGGAAPAPLHAQIVEDDDVQLVAQRAQQVQHGSGDAAADQHAAAEAAAGSAAAAGEAAARSGKPPAADYRLHAVVNHKGPAASCGHFTSDIRDAASGVWHRFDDSLASRISAWEARSGEKQRECYLLFYAVTP